MGFVRAPSRMRLTRLCGVLGRAAPIEQPGQRASVVSGTVFRHHAENHPPAQPDSVRLAFRPPPQGIRVCH